MKEERDVKRVKKYFPPFPVALVTVDENIISVGLIHVFSFEPPMIGIGISPRRYSHALLKKTGDFGVNIPTLGMMDAVEGCGTTSGRTVKKFEAFSLTPKKPAKIRSLLIEECPVNIECKVIKRITCGSHDWFIGEVVAIRSDEHYNYIEALLYGNREYRRVGEALCRRKK